MVTSLQVQGRELHFPTPLTEARIVDRPNRFIINAEVGGRVLRCHSAVTGRIGGLTLNGLPCLLSFPSEPNVKRTTEATVEAIALEEHASSTFQWIGVNQPRANSFVEAALAAGLFAPEFSHPRSIRREQKLGSSRIDLLVDGDYYIEVKMPLLELAAVRQEVTPWKDFGLGSSSPRFERQLQDLMDAITAGKRAGQLTVFSYHQTGPMSEAEQFARNITYHPLQEEAEAAGMKRWRVELEFSPTHVTVGKLREVAAGSYRLPTV
jgi:sugar fermentation stimulation protein A